MKKSIKKYYWIIGAPILLWLFMLAMAEREDINNNKAETFGIVYGSSSIRKKYSRRNYKYEFYFNGQKYTGSSSASLSKKVKKGNFYKVEFSDKNPEHSRMVFDIAYLQKLKTDADGKLVDTIYVAKNQELQNRIKDRVEEYKFEIDSTKN